MHTIIITPPDPIRDETILCNALFAHGLEILHLRKPGYGQEVYEQFILQIEPRYRNRIVVHEHYELANRYQLHGIHLRSGQCKINILEQPSGTISLSCHSLEEIRTLPFCPDYCFLSPVFDSISKPGYQNPFKGVPDLSDIRIPVYALGGITPEHITTCQQAGFYGTAALGYIWEKPDEALQRFIRLKTPYVMSIAGFDPSSGAGVTADLKTFEATGSYGLGICSALTFQNEKEYTGTQWVKTEDIEQQYKLQFKQHQPEYVKIGLIENFDVLERIIHGLSTSYPRVKIIWDPILKASTGFVFHAANLQERKQLLQHIYLLTPNAEEIRQLFGENISIEKLQHICRQYQLNVLWKGGHEQGDYSTDRLVTPEEIYAFSVKRNPYTKHGTGCVLSSAIASALAQGDELLEACHKAQLYVSRLIDSNDSLLGYHFLDKAGLSPRPSPDSLNLQYITAPKEGVSICEQVEAVCRGGVRWVQLRMKGASFAEICKEGIKVKEICRRYNALFIVNDDAEAARQIGADGVHLGKEDMSPEEARKIIGKNKIIGATCNTWEDILLRQKQGVDYIGLGPYTFTTTKEKLSPVLGLEGYRNLSEQMKASHITLPVFAIGGITEKDIPTLMQTGIQGIALSGLIKNSPDMTRKTVEVIRILEQEKNHPLNCKPYGTIKNCR